MNCFFEACRNGELGRAQSLYAEFGFSPSVLENEALYCVVTGRHFHVLQWLLSCSQARAVTSDANPDWARIWRS